MPQPVARDSSVSPSSLAQDSLVVSLWGIGCAYRSGVGLVSIVCFPIGKERKYCANPSAGDDRMNFDDVDFLIEYAEIYDGWSVAVMKDGTCVNRWEDPENPGCAIPGCERLLEATRKALEVTGCQLSEARRLLPEGSQVTGTISVVPQPGVIGVFVDLPHGMAGFVDVLKLPRRARQWPQPGQALRFEVLQHTPGQVRLWPLDPRFHHDGTSPEAEAEWRQAKLRYPVGSTVSAQVEHVHAYNREYWIRFTGDDSQHWSGALLPWTGEQPVEGSTGQYRIVAHLDTTRRIMVAPAG